MADVYASVQTELEQYDRGQHGTYSMRVLKLGVTGGAAEQFLS